MLNSNTIGDQYLFGFIKIELPVIPIPEPCWTQEYFPFVIRIDRHNAEKDKEHVPKTYFSGYCPKHYEAHALGDKYWNQLFTIDDRLDDMLDDLPVTYFGMDDEIWLKKYGGLLKKYEKVEKEFQNIKRATQKCGCD